MNTIEIVKVNTKNYHLYCDMIHKRIKGRERNLDEKLETKIKHYKRIEEELSNPNFYVYAAEYNKKFIGWIHGVYIPKIGKWTEGILFLDEIWVDPDYRNQGVGEMLMLKMKEIKKVMKVKKLRLYTDNQTAKTFFEKCGIKTVCQCHFMED